MPQQQATTRRAPGRRKKEADPGRTVLHVSAEYLPFARTGGLGEAAAGLAEAQAGLGRTVMALMPLYDAVRAVAPDLVPVGDPFEVTLGTHTETVQLYREDEQRGGVDVVFLDAPGSFRRRGIYGERGSDYPDNYRRFAFFSRAALSAAERLVAGPMLIHVHDWHTGMLPLYARKDPAFAARLRAQPLVLSTHNAGYQGWFPGETARELAIPPQVSHLVLSFGQVNFLKSAIAFADAVVTVSPAHADELRTDLGGFGLQDMFRALDDRFVGICNGIDQGTWGPRADPHIASVYSLDSMDGKAACKAALQKEMGLPCRPDVPVFVTASRVVEQKGFDLVLASERVRSLDAQFIFLGQGDPRFEHALAERALQSPDRVACEFDFTEEREHRLLAGADVLLMPCLYEPCGLSQMRAQRYGVLVVARNVGGLRDTVVDGETGFIFEEYTAAAFDRAVDRAVEGYRDAEEWRRMMRSAMQRDFGWEQAAERYAAVYEIASARAQARAESRA